jgi:Lon protease-like protein
VFVTALMVCTMVCALPGNEAVDASASQSAAAGTPSSASPLPATIPIFPLPDVMLFPASSVPLYIFEPRYRAMVGDALDGNRIIGMVLLRPGYEKNYEGRPSVFPIGCAGVIEDFEALPNGEYNILLRAIAKFRITGEELGKPYRLANVTALPEVLNDQERTDLTAQRQQLETVLAGSAGRFGQLQIPSGLSDEEVVNGVAQLVDIDALDRLRLLDQARPLTLSRALFYLLKKTL